MATTVTWLPGQRDSGDGCSSGGGGGNGGSEHPQQGWWRMWWQHRQHRRPPRRCADDSLGGSCDGGAGGCSRLMLLASLSSSAVAAASRRGGGGGAGGAVTGSAAAATAGPAAGPRRGFHLPQLSIMRLPGSESFAEEQDLAQELLDYHTAKHGCFPRPCPRCNSHDFMVRRPDTPATSPGAATGADATSSSSSAGAGAGGGAGVVEWRSRPLRCETCGCWVHLGCAGVELAEQVPPRPWFHSRACRDTYLRLEAAAERNPHPSSASGTHTLYLLTPVDLLAAGGVAAAADGTAATAAPAGNATAVAAFSGRGPAGAVVPLLLQGFNTDAVQGFGQPAREYDGGKYGAVLLSRGQPVAAATFNVFGADAQLCLLATAVQHRLKGNGSALVADLEATLAALGVSRMLVQARGVALPLWLGRLGYEVVPPREAAELHARLPIAYYDCALLQKQLTALPSTVTAAAAAAAAAAGGRSGSRATLQSPGDEKYEDKDAAAAAAQRQGAKGTARQG